MSASPDRKALAILVLGACIIALTPILVRLTETGPAAAGLWRLACALPFLIPLWALERTRTRSSGRPPYGLFVVSAVLFSADLAFWHYGIRYTSVTNATVLSNLTPIVVTAAAWVMFRERPQRVFLLGMMLAVGGAIAMGLAKGGGGRGLDPPLGNALSVFTAIWYGGYFVAVRELRKRAGTMAVMLWCSVIGAPLLLIAGLLLGEPILPATAAGWEACIALGFVHVAGQGCIAWALGRLPASLTAVVVLIQPVVAAALGWMLFGEAIVPLQAVGGVIALVGVAVAQAGARRAAPSQGEAEAVA